MRGAALACAIAVSGCSIVLAPDRDAIVPSMDGGSDGGFDGGHDGGDGGDLDGGFDAGDAGTDACVVGEEREVTCNDGIDNDCDGNADCDDPHCGADGYCCDPGGAGVTWPGDAVAYDAWTPFGAPTTTSGTVAFGTATSQVVHPDCAPLAFGMRFTVEFVRAGTNGAHYASFVLAPVDRPRGGGDMTLLADLALRVTGAGTARLERAGTVIGETAPGMELPVRSEAQIDLTPSVDGSGRPVLLVRAEISGRILADDVVLMPLADLIGAEAGCAPDGLHLAYEGRGSTVSIGSATTTGIGDCDNPTQFLSDAMGPLAEADVLPPGELPGEWRAGGAGEPALSSRATGVPLATTQVDLLVDASVFERDDEIFRFIDFAIGGSLRTSRWTHRASLGDARLFGPSPSSREPSFAGGAALDPHLVAYARATAPMSDVYELAWANLDRMATASPGPSQALLEPSDTPCDSLRDPAVIAPVDRDSLLVFFTCERAGSPDSIGVARLTLDVVDGYVVAGEVRPDLLHSSIGSYARQGVFSPEVVVTGASGTTRALRIWFLARDAGGRVRVGLAYGEVDATAGLPVVTPYPGNPILSADDQLLGGPCPLGCAIESLGVTATEGRSTLWPAGFGREPSYIFLIERSRFRSDGVDHQLVPLRQPRPSDG